MKRINLFHTDVAKNLSDMRFRNRVPAICRLGHSGGTQCLLEILARVTPVVILCEEDKQQTFRMNPKAARKGAHEDGADSYRRG